MVFEPVHDTTARDTAISKIEGRLKVSVGYVNGKKKHLRRIIKGLIKKIDRKHGL